MGVGSLIHCRLSVVKLILCNGVDECAQSLMARQSRFPVYSGNGTTCVIGPVIHSVLSLSSL
jgi:hypothetical protein